MELPGLNPIHNKIPSTPQSGVPDLILNVPPRGQPPMAPGGPAIAPHHAPLTPQIQHSTQSLQQALAEMNVSPTPQNLQIAQQLANYGHPVNQRTMQMVQQALGRLADKSPAAVEAAVVLMTQELPVNEQTVAATKQFLNGKPLPEQLQQLQQQLKGLLQHLKSPDAQGRLVQLMQLSGESAKLGMVQQSVGQAQATQQRAELSSTKATTAEKVQLPEAEKAQVNKTSGLNVNPAPQNLPPATGSSGRSLEHLQLGLHAGAPLEDILQHIRSGQMSPEQVARHFLLLAQDILGLSERLLQAMLLKNQTQLPQNQKMMTELTGLLQYKIQEFRELFKQMFPDIAHQLASAVDLEGMDMLSRLAHLIEEGRNQVTAQLRYATEQLKNLPDEQALLNLREVLENVGQQVEKLALHFGAREVLTQNGPSMCIPFVVQVGKEQHLAELKIEQEDNPARHTPGHGPIKISLTLETKNLGRVGVDLSALKQDMHVDLKVLNRRVMLLVQERLSQLKHKLEDQHFQVQHLHCRVAPELESRHSMLLPPRQVVRSLKRIEGIV